MDFELQKGGETVKPRNLHAVSDRSEQA
ncbi:hypothetical protein DXF93_07475 [Escherichia coli]|nr:hypothetical protein C2U51_18485 [Enterobacteriaceae bacterium ENNIH1]RDT55373.1 hypothetical protein DXF93_07475 [Escherichia coli]